MLKIRMSNITMTNVHNKAGYLIYNNDKNIIYDNYIYINNSKFKGFILLL